MSQSTLRQVLTIFETAVTPLSLPQIARQLDVSPQRLETMIQHWVRKGKIRESGSLTECGSCGQHGACPFVMEMPRTYELARETDVVSLHNIGLACPQSSTK
ncbi:FeoC-like transcriptional regulator [Candidatus Leptofilum sp.]|uniref:FeoC-like transcriptional regulator n=1 Tax=Candidatus Leptofilum sp. TaxID=3241576 RepID=UPI003B59B65F